MTAKKQKTDHVSPTRPTIAPEEAVPQTLAAEAPSDQLTREYHVYQLELDQTEVMVRFCLLYCSTNACQDMFADHDRSSRPKAILLLTTDELCWSTYRMRGKIPALSHTITQYDLRVKYIERVVSGTNQVSEQLA